MTHHLSDHTVFGRETISRSWDRSNPSRSCCVGGSLSRCRPIRPESKQAWNPTNIRPGFGRCEKPVVPGISWADHISSEWSLVYSSGQSVSAVARLFLGQSGESKAWGKNWDTWDRKPCLSTSLISYPYISWLLQALGLCQRWNYEFAFTLCRGVHKSFRGDVCFVLIHL